MGRTVCFLAIIIIQVISFDCCCGRDQFYANISILPFDGAHGYIRAVHSEVTFLAQPVITNCDLDPQLTWSLINATVNKAKLQQAISPCEPLEIDENASYELKHVACNCTESYYNVSLRIRNLTKDEDNVYVSLDFRSGISTTTNVPLIALYCSLDPLNYSVSVSSQDPAYKKPGLYHCVGNGVLFSSSGSQMSNQTICKADAMWENQNEVQCWYEPDVTMEGINVEESNNIFTVNASESFKVQCKYCDVFPPGNESSYFFNNTNSTRAKTGVYALTLTRNDNQKKLWCQALTPFTEYFSGNGTSPIYTINVRYSPHDVVNSIKTSKYVIHAADEYFMRSDQNLSMKCSSDSNPSSRCCWKFCTGSSKECITCDNETEPCLFNSRVAYTNCVWCTATNSLGSRNSSTQTITVIPQFRFVNLTVFGYLNQSNFTTAVVTRKENITLVCNITYQDDLNTTVMIIPPNSDTPQNELHIDLIDRNDSGNYTCHTNDVFGNFTGHLCIDVVYAPYSEDSNDCQCMVGQNCSCNISFFSNPNASFVSLNKNGKPIEDASNQLTPGGETYQQMYTFTEDMFEEVDSGTYILVLHSPFDNSHHNIMFEVMVHLYPSSSKPPNSDPPIPVIIGVVVGGVALIIVIVVLIWCCQKRNHKKSDDASTPPVNITNRTEDNGSNENEQRVNPLYVSADHSEQVDGAYAEVQTTKPAAESSEKEERQNPLYESSNPQDQVAYAVVEKKKGKKHEKKLRANPIYVPSDSHGAVQDAYATVEKKTNSKTKKGKKVDQVAMTPIGGNNVDVAYAEVDKTKKKSSKDRVVVASVDSNNQAAGTSAAAEYAEVKKTKPKKPTKPVQGTIEDETSDLHGSDMNSVIKEKPPVPSRRHINLTMNKQDVSC